MTDKITILQAGPAVYFEQQPDGSHAQRIALVSAASRAQVDVVRPANVAPYAAGDVVGGVIVFPAMGKAGAGILITSAQLLVAIGAVPAGMAAFRLHLYNVTPPSALVDNVAWNLPAGDRAAYQGYIDIDAPADLGATLYAQTDAINKQIKLAAAETALYGYLATIGSYTPAANSEVYTVSLDAVAL